MKYGRRDSDVIVLERTQLGRGSGTSARTWGQARSQNDTSTMICSRAAFSSTKCRTEPCAKPDEEARASVVSYHYVQHTAFNTSLRPGAIETVSCFDCPWRAY
jgi:hypothetical protein